MRAVGALQRPYHGKLGNKKLCRVKEKLKSWTKSPKYSIDLVYKDLLGTTDKVHWTDTVWNRAVIPRSRFVVWLSYHERLKTKQRLKRVGVVEDNRCPLCDSQTETIEHLFFNCDFSCQCVEALKHWLGVTWSIKNMNDLHRKRRMPKTQWRLTVAIFCNLIYAIWNVRNEAVWQKKVSRIQTVVETIKIDFKIRFSSIILNESTYCWLRNL